MKDVGYIHIWIEQEHDTYWENIKIIKDDLKDEYTIIRSTFDDSLNSYSCFSPTKEDAVLKIKNYLRNVILQIKRYAGYVNAKVPFEVFNENRVGLKDIELSFESENKKLRFDIESCIYYDDSENRFFKDDLVYEWRGLISREFNPKKKYKFTVKRVSEAAVVIEAASKAEAQKILDLTTNTVNYKNHHYFNYGEIEELS